jgi:hypothetical protein
MMAVAAAALGAKIACPMLLCTAPVENALAQKVDGELGLK